MVAVAQVLQATQGQHCAYQIPFYSRFLPTPADLIAVLFPHTHRKADAEPRIHCPVPGVTRAGVAKTWGSLHRETFYEPLARGTTVHLQWRMRALRLESEPYQRDASGASCRRVDHPCTWPLYCGDPYAIHPEARSLGARPSADATG